MSAIANLDLISKIWPVTVYSRPVPIIKSIIKLSDLVNNTDIFAPHVMGGVDKLHAEGYNGQGIRVAVIDSGVDYRYDNYFFVYINISLIYYLDIQH